MITMLNAVHKRLCWGLHTSTASNSFIDSNSEIVMQTLVSVYGITAKPGGWQI